ncbi:MAG: hypothetical protein WB808_13770 [Candidatus Dormiibacterota bacterium]
MLGQGVHPKLVSEMLGHATVAITLDLYSHATAAMHREAATTLDALLRNTPGRRLWVSTRPSGIGCWWASGGRHCCAGRWPPGEPASRCGSVEARPDPSHFNLRPALPCPGDCGLPTRLRLTPYRPLQGGHFRVIPGRS